MNLSSRVRILDKGTLTGRVGTVTKLGRKVTVEVDKYAWEKEAMAAEVAPENLEELKPADAVLAHLTATANASSFIVDEPVGSGVRAKRGHAKHKLTLKAQGALTADQIELLVALLQGKGALMSIGGETYVVRRTELGHEVRGTRPGDPPHTVLDGACSCEDYRFRHHQCKHIKAVEAL